MAMDCLEANSMKQIPILRGEGDLNSSAIETLKPEKIVLDKISASKKVRQFYFVKFWPYKDPDEASKISEAEKLIEKFEQERIRVHEKRRMSRSRGKDVWSQLQQLTNRERSISHGLGKQKIILDYLQVVLNKLSKGGANKSIFSTGRNTHDFQSRMLHGSSNLATEKQLFRDIARSQQSLNDLEPRSLFQEYIDWLYGDGRHVDKARYTQMFEKLKQIDERKEKALVDSAKKGEIWTNCRYHEYLSLLNNARELGKKNDIEALRKLSEEQVNEFMSEWNQKYDRTFRISYKISIIKSLDKRQLSRDGRISNYDQDTIT
ncbi:hypothetical protein REPUB_Repub15cG0137900 [Reevesia pubescens]